MRFRLEETPTKLHHRFGETAAGNGRRDSSGRDRLEREEHQTVGSHVARMWYHMQSKLARDGNSVLGGVVGNQYLALVGRPSEMGQARGLCCAAVHRGGSRDGHALTGA